MALVAALSLTACGGSEPTGPSPTPSPSRVTINGTLTDTVSGAPLGPFSQEVSGLPALVNVSAAGHLTRQAWVTSASPTVDLIPDAAPFDLGFYRQLVRDGLESPGALQPLRPLSASPSIYLQRAGLTDATVAAFEQAARGVVPALTGGRLAVATFASGAEARPTAGGWIVAELVSDDVAP